MNGDPAGKAPARDFARLIAAEGPISVARFMAEANARYYSSRDPIGAGGDFVTAPEISQLFGEMIGLWLADVWRRAGAPEPVAYAELGPGRGTLARDVLAVMRRFGLRPQVHLVEASPVLRRAQAALVPQASWHDHPATLPAAMPLLLVANEFFDALPVRQLVCTPGGWRERMVGLRGGALAFVAGDQPMDPALPAERRQAPEGAIIETSPAASAIVADLAGALARQGGAGLIIDYGHASPRLGSTLQAVRGQRRLDPLAAPGEADLSAHVDFAALAQAVASGGARWLGTVPQGAWLRELGVGLRAASLARAAPGRADELAAALARLTGEEAMGSLFQVLGLAAPHWPAGAGF